MIKRIHYGEKPGDRIQISGFAGDERLVPKKG
jgi:hypothetical protein